MDYQSFYQDAVYPQLDFRIVSRYPLVNLSVADDYTPLSRHSVIMLVALTGTGKTTTLDTLKYIAGKSVEQSITIIPSRREVADWIAIPTAQVLLNEPIVSVKDRVQRFRYTHTFAEYVTGGMATAFSWVNVKDDYNNLIISEGIRGANEITYALTNFPTWHIIELALHPLTRLKRLSSRRHKFDRVEGKTAISFLPDDLQKEAKELVQAGEITLEALAITRAESENYGFYPFDDGARYTNYHRINVDERTPEQVAVDVHDIIKDITNAND